MISNQVLKKSMEELSGIMGVGFALCDMEGKMVASAGEYVIPDQAVITDVAELSGGYYGQEGACFCLVLEEQIPVYILGAFSQSGDRKQTAKEMPEEQAISVVSPSEQAHVQMAARIAVSQLQQLLLAYQQKIDRNHFFYQLLQGEYSDMEIYQKAKRMHIREQMPRTVFRIETGTETGIEEMETAAELLRGMYTTQMGDYVTLGGEGQVVLIKSIRMGIDSSEEDRIAQTIVDMMNTEALLNVRVGYGSVVEKLHEIKKSYKEAGVALEVGRIFYVDRKVNAYHSLGVGRLIHELPHSLCRSFLQEVLGKERMPEFDEETLITVQRFFENNLNVSETARKLFIHRNTLVYRIEKLERATGLDIRRFEDALTFKLALMVSDFIRYLKQRKE